MNKITENKITDASDEGFKTMPEKISNGAQHRRRWVGIGCLSLSLAEVVCCINMPFLFVPVGIFAFVNSVVGIIHLFPYFDCKQEAVQNKFFGVLNFFDTVKKIAIMVFGIGLCCGVPFYAPITALLSTFGVGFALTVKVGLMVYGICGLIAKVAPRLPRNLWIFFKNGIISLIPGIYKGSFGKAIAISREEIEYRNENDTVEGFDINKAIPKLNDSGVINSDENDLK